MNYHIFDKLIHVQIKGENYSIATDSENFELLRDSLLKGNTALAETLLKAETKLEVDCLVEKDDDVYFKDIKVPTTICDLLMKKNTASMACLNYWINHTRREQTLDTNTLLKLVGKSVFPVDSSGFLFLSEKPIDGPEFFQCELSENNQELLSQGVEGVCQHIFGVATKKLIQTAKKALFSRPVVNDDFFDLCRFISAYQPNADVDTIVRLIDSPLSECLRGNNGANLQVVANLLGGVFNAGKLIRLLDEESQLLELKHNFEVVADSWRELEGRVPLKSRYQNIPDLITFLTLEAKKERQKDFELKQQLNFPWLEEFDGETIEDYTVKVATTKYELLEWSSILGNCLDTYPTRVLSGEVMILGLMAHDQIKYAVEIKSNGKIGQFEGKSRSECPPSLKALVQNQIKRFGK